MDNFQEHPSYGETEVESLASAVKHYKDQNDLLVLGLLQEKTKSTKLLAVCEDALVSINTMSLPRLLSPASKDEVLTIMAESFKAVIAEVVEKTDICPICGDEKPVGDLHRNCGK